jgi:glutathione S-transferase
MKIYETRSAPNPRRVRIFLAEKSVNVKYVQIDIEGRENLTPEFQAKSMKGKIPVLELDDGTCISETMAICRYFEELFPDPLLLGETPLHKAQIEMWQRRMEFGLLMPVAMCFQHSTGYFKDRMTPVPEWGAESGKQVPEFYAYLNEHLADNTYIAGEEFSVADITALCAIDFARVLKIRMGEAHPHLQRWHDLLQQRESVKA